MSVNTNDSVNIFMLQYILKVIEFEGKCLMGPRAIREQSNHRHGYNMYLPNTNIILELPGGHILVNNGYAQGNAHDPALVTITKIMFLNGSLNNLQLTAHLVVLYCDLIVIGLI